MSFNVPRGALRTLDVQSSRKQVCHSVFALIFLLLFIFAGSAQAAGDAEFANQVKQVNDSLGQLHQHAQGDPEAMRVVDNFEKSWKQLQSQLGMLQRSQQQSAALRQTQTKLLAQQKEFMNLLTKLQQQVASSKRPELKTIDPFGDYRAHGVSIRPKDGKLHGPDTGVKEPAGKEVWTDADRLLKGLSILSSSTTTPPAVSSQTPNKKGVYDNPLANDPNVVDLTGVANPVVQSLKGADPERSLKVNPEPMSEVMAKFLESAAVAEEAKSWGLKKILKDAVRQVQDGADQFDLFHYGYWYGENVSGGPRGDRGPVDSLDAIAMHHDFLYEAARIQGKIYGPQEELRLQAMADAIAVTAASKLRPDPAEWDLPAKDPKKADMYRDGIIWVFGNIMGPKRTAMSMIPPPVKDITLGTTLPQMVKSWVSWEITNYYFQDVNAINKYDARRLDQAADVLQKQWLKKHPNAPDANASR